MGTWEAKWTCTAWARFTKNVCVVCGFLIFEGNTVLGHSYLEILKDWLFPQHNEDSEDFIFQQDRAPPHWHNQVCQFLIKILPQHWICHTYPKTWHYTLGPKISRHYTLWLFLVGICKTMCLCSTITHWLGWAQKQNSGCCNFCGRRHSHSWGQIQLSSWCYPCNRWRAHRAFITWRVNLEDLLNSL